MKTIAELKSKRFRVYVFGEVERTTNWRGVQKLLWGWSNYDRYTAEERKSFLASAKRTGIVYIDANISCKAINRRASK